MGEFLNNKLSHQGSSLPCSVSQSKQAAVMFSFPLYFLADFNLPSSVGQKVSWTKNLCFLSINSFVMILFLIEKVITGILTQHAHLVITHNFCLTLYSSRNTLLAIFYILFHCNRNRNVICCTFVLCKPNYSMKSSLCWTNKGWEIKHHYERKKDFHALKPFD